MSSIARRRQVVVVVTLVAGFAAAGGASEPIDCGRADTRVTVSVSSHLDPSCTWTRGVQIVASDVVLDCQGARIVAPERQRGIEITAPTDTALSNITVRNCYVEGFLNNVRITREGFRQLAEGVEYINAFSNIVIEDSTFMNSRGVGVFVDGYVTGVTLRNLHIEGSGSSGVYLEAGSKDNVLENNDIVNNGYRENSPDGELYDFGGVTYWFWGTGREGLSIDGSRFNRIVNNRFSGNSYGGIFLYKNCGEYVNVRPDRWWHRRYGADGNLIEDNTFTGEDNGVWIGARMSQNTLPMDCSDPPYLSGFVLDYADGNTVRNNAFHDVTYGVRVEDDGNTLTGNQFSGAAAEQALVIGTRQRTETLGLPVTTTTVTGNVATIPANPHPYRWIHGHRDTIFGGNTSLGREVDLCEGVQPWTGPFVMAVAVTVPGPNNTPPGPPPAVPQPGPLPACVYKCDLAAPIERGAILIHKLDTPPGDDGLVFRGRITLVQPFSPLLDPVTRGVHILVTDAAGNRPLDLVVPGGTYDAGTKIGWRTMSRGRRWHYVNRGTAPEEGVTDVVLYDLSHRRPGLVAFRVRGRRDSYAVDLSNLPLSGWLLLDPPTADSGQCGAVSFTTQDKACTGNAHSIRCN